MAAAVVVKPEYALPSAEGDAITINYTLAIIPGSGSPVIIESCDVVMLPGDTPNAINTKIGQAVRARAASYGLTLPSNSVVAPSYSKA